MKRKSKKWIWLSVIALVLVAAGLAAWFLIPREPTDPVYVYDMSFVGMTDYMDYSNQSSGMVTTDRVQSVYLTSTQTVTEVKVQPGQRVNKGAVLYTYDTTLSALSLERKDLSIKQMELNLAGLQKELKTINGYKPISYYGGSSTTRPSTTAPAATTDLSKAPSSITGDYISRNVGNGTSGSPMYYWVSSDFNLDGFIQQELVNHAGDNAAKLVYVVLQMSKSNTAGSAIVQEMGIVLEQETIHEIPDPTEDPTEPSEEPTEPSENPTEPSEEPTEPSEEPVEQQQHSDAAPSDGSNEKFTYQVKSFFLPPDHTAVIVTPPSNNSPNVNWNSGFTSTEIASMKAAKQQEIKEKQFEIKMAKAEYKIMQNEADDGKVVADFDGVVVSVGDPETAFTNNEPLIKISGGGGYFIEGTVSELALDTIEVGQEVQINSWMTGVSCVGTISEIGEYPVENEYYYGGSSNVSQYPYKVFVDESYDLTDGDWVDMTLTNTSASSALYLETPFVLTENNRSYVYVQNAEGLLEKRQIVTGANLWGSYVEICSGLTPADLVAFPYGKTVKDGAPTELGTWETLYDYNY